MNSAAGPRAPRGSLPLRREQDMNRGGELEDGSLQSGSGRIGIQPQILKPIDDSRDAFLQFYSGQRRARAGADSDAESQVLSRVFTFQVDLVGVVESGGVAVSRRDDRRDLVPAVHLRSVEVTVALADAVAEMHGADQAQRLFNESPEGARVGVADLLQHSRCSEHQVQRV